MRVSPRSAIRNEPWDSWVRRVILHVPTYLSTSGHPTSGGLQRKVRDIGRLIRDNWGRDCVIVQKARRGFEIIDESGFTVIGIPSQLSVRGDPGFGLATSRMVQSNDAIIYMGG